MARLSRPTIERLQSAPKGARVIWCCNCGRVYMDVPTHGIGRQRYTGEELQSGSADCGTTMGAGSPQECIAAFAETVQ